MESATTKFDTHSVMTPAEVAAYFGQTPPEEHTRITFTIGVDAIGSASRLLVVADCPHDDAKAVRGRISDALHGLGLTGSVRQERVTYGGDGRDGRRA